MTPIDPTKPVACRNGSQAEVTGKGETFLTGAYIDSHDRPWPIAWRLDGRIYTDRESRFDLVNVLEPKPEPIVRWAMVGDTAIGTFPTKAEAERCRDRYPSNARIVKLVEAPDDQL